MYFYCSRRLLQYASEIQRNRSKDVLFGVISLPAFSADQISTQVSSTRSLLTNEAVKSTAGTCFLLRVLLCSGQWQTVISITAIIKAFNFNFAEIKCLSFNLKECVITERQNDELLMVLQFSGMFPICCSGMDSVHSEHAGKQ